MPSFMAGAFAVAGAIAALGPVVIHLLNRRRFRVVSWAAMELLREAMIRSRRMLRVRDLLLLLLRTACLLIFGLAMARPYFSAGAGADDASQAVHAVIIVDNSLSMGYTRLEGTMLDEAKSRAAEFLGRLPPGSRITVLPLCGSATPVSYNAWHSATEARDALSRIEVVDRTGTAIQAAELARDACALVPDLPARRVVFLSDQQRITWPAEGLSAAFQDLPEIQVVQIAAEAAENAWVADVRVQDGIADASTSAIIRAKIGFVGSAPRPHVEVGLTVAGSRVASQTVDLEPGQLREVRFEHRFEADPRDGQATFVPAMVSLTPDRLPTDDARHLAVPVVGALPVVFVDQFGGGLEDPSRNRYGETYPLRRLLAPVTSRGAGARQAEKLRHVTMEGLDRQILADARLVVVAGITQPGPAVALLREYVEQGGQLVVAAGAGFDPQAWGAAWQEGAGILPLPLEPRLVGRLPDAGTSNLEPFLLDPTSMADEFFDVADSSREELDDTYRTPLFFQAVAVDRGEDVLRALKEADERRIADRRAARAGESESDLRELRWLLWRPAQVERAADLDPAELAAREQPRVLAAFTNHVPFLVERRIEDGDLLFVSSGLFPRWNNLARTYAVLLFDRLLRTRLARTVPIRTYSTHDVVRLDIDAADRRAEFRLERPDRPPTEAFVDAVGPDEFAVNVRNLTERGDYRLTAERSHDDEAASATPRATGARPSGERLWEVEFAVNGPASESELTYLDEAGVRERLGNVPMRWIAPGEPIHLEGALVRGQDLWQWLLAVALACLLVELIVLAAGQAVADRRAAAVTAPGGVAAASGVPAFGGTNSERGGR